MKSFAAKVRDSLTREDAAGGKPCCRRAELTGLSLACGAISFIGGGAMRLSYRSEHPGTVRRIAKLLKAELSVSPLMRASRANRLGGRTTFDVRLDTAETIRAMQTCGLTAIPRGFPKGALVRKCCRNALLRGVFLGCGTVSDPARGCQMEFVLDSEAVARALLRFLGAFCRVKSGLAVRKSAYVVYIKGSDGISTVLTMIGASGAVLEFENERIRREARNQANRAANCDAANVAKMLEALNRQLEAIERIDAAIGIASLPDTLREVAIERRMHADATLEELGALLDPPLGKSGVYHRLRRIEAIAKTLENS